ncbi:MAG: hypothetical protein M1823_009096, partial [Watsoniomyces obsoletus]
MSQVYDATPCTPPASSIEGPDGGVFQTPHNFRQVQLHARQILDHIHEDMEIDPDARVLHAQIGQLARAAETS